MATREKRKKVKAVEVECAEGQSVVVELDRVRSLVEEWMPVVNAAKKAYPDLNCRKEICLFSESEHPSEFLVIEPGTFHFKSSVFVFEERTYEDWPSVEALEKELDNDRSAVHELPEPGAGDDHEE